MQNFFTIQFTSNANSLATRSKDAIELCSRLENRDIEGLTVDMGKSSDEHQNVGDIVIIVFTSAGATIIAQLITEYFLKKSRKIIVLSSKGVEVQQSDDAITITVEQQDDE